MSFYKLFFILLFIILLLGLSIMIHNIRYRVFIYDKEDKDEILEALLNILPTAEPEVEEAEEKPAKLTPAQKKKGTGKNRVGSMFDLLTFSDV